MLSKYILSAVNQVNKKSTVVFSNSIRLNSTFAVNYDDVSVKHKFLTSDRQVAILGVPVCYGQPRQGVEKGPEDLRSHGLIAKIENEGWNVVDHGDIEVKQVKLDDTDHAVEQTTDFKFKCAEELADINKRTADEVYKLALEDNFVLTVGGDHSIAIGSIAGILKARPETAILWVDAHADINTPRTSNSGNIHGMPVSLLMKHPECLPLGPFSWLNDIPTLQMNRIAYIGLRDLDRGERRILKQSGIRAFTMQDVDRFGIGNVMTLAIDHLRGGVDRPIHLSFDIDGIDPVYAPATGTTVQGGLTHREGFYICESLAETGLLSSMDIVEVNSSLARKKEDSDATISMSLRLVASALGNRLL